MEETVPGHVNWDVRVMSVHCVLIKIRFFCSRNSEVYPDACTCKNNIRQCYYLNILGIEKYS